MDHLELELTCEVVSLFILFLVEMSVKQSNTSNLSLPSTDTENRVANPGNTTSNISKKESKFTFTFSIILFMYGTSYMGC